ncbi:hypothetical protein [Microbacterium pygmaeum]|uniref:Uncharacterized protein n=1 Tax=Microbacterium pygmaeum TaxID=370764 RepID=A0A1G7TK34_9MICO|nr:hypothetical protein [Microbacterium pygmaeum]SDG35462.1 hypothetical protein SAMN04489810_0074 [Microbacterium pygmaeum]
MSDSKSSYGEPVEEPTAEGDVVGSAHEGIAEAEAARRDAVSPAEADAAASQPAYAGPVTPTAEEPVYTDASSGDLSYIDTTPETDATAATTAYAPVEHETVVAPVVTASEPARDTDYSTDYATVPVVAGTAAAGTAAAGAYAPQPIFVQAPEAPNPRGNRGAAGAIGLLAAISFAVLYLAAWLGFGLLSGAVAADDLGTAALSALTTWSLWVPVVVFFIAFWLLGAIINRGRWAAWVIFGLLVGVASYAGHILGALFQAPFWMLTASEGSALVERELLAPLAIAAFVIGRELTIWFGAWVAKRGARVTELNIEAQREYERTLEAGPQLTRV